MKKEIVIDGSAGEGGGQILRTSLSLSMITGTPVRLNKIRAGRKKPGLMRQHLTCVRAAKEVSGAEVAGDEIGSQEILFRPGRIEAGSYHFPIGSAGATVLVAQTVLPALMLQAEKSQVILEGGTHNIKAPPFDFFAKSFLPLLERMGFSATARLDRHGFYPAGGGRFILDVEPVGENRPLELKSRGDQKNCLAEAIFANLDMSIAERELKIVHKRLGWEDELLKLREVKSVSPGNILLLTLESENVTEVFSGHGILGVSAENVAKNACKGLSRYLTSDAAVGPHLADQLLVPMVLCGGGSFTTLRPSLHTRTNIEVIRSFLDVDIRLEEVSEKSWLLEIR